MRKMLLVLAGLLLIASPCFAQGGYVGLFTDEAHSSCSYSSAVPYSPFTLYIYWLPSALGMQAAEFMLVIPANVLTTSTTTNPDITVSLGSFTAGMSVAFGTCHDGGTWVWTHHVACLLANSTSTTIEITGDPTAQPPVLGIASCELGYPLYNATKYADLALNHECTIGTRSATWGAIKSLF